MRLVYLGIILVLWKGPMKEYFRKFWVWLGPEENRGRVKTIATVVGVIIAMIGLIITFMFPPLGDPPTDKFKAGLEKRGREVRQSLNQEYGEERARLENELEEVTRQLSNY